MKPTGCPRGFQLGLGVLIEVTIHRGVRHPGTSFHRIALENNGVLLRVKVDWAIEEAGQR